jgi:hypothetical protein
MATVFREMGYPDDAINVQIAAKWDEGVEIIRKDFDIFVHSATHVQVLRLMGTTLRIIFHDALWFFGFGWLIGYGYRPWNALFISLGFVFIGTIIFRFAQQKNILIKSNGTHPAALRARRIDRNFSAFIYSLETFVPLVKLGVADYWKIEANVSRPIQMDSVMLREPGIIVLWYYRIHIIAGWVFTSLWVAAFSGILKS